jgi:hypothetical protein
MNGAEEDGVDNRVEAPSRLPDEGSDGTPPEPASDGGLTPAPPAEAAAPEAEAWPPQAAFGSTTPEKDHASAADARDRPAGAEPAKAAGSAAPPDSSIWARPAASSWQGDSQAWQSGSWQSADAGTDSPHLWTGDRSSASPGWQSEADSPADHGAADHGPDANHPASPSNGYSGTHPMPSLMSPPADGAAGASISGAAIQASAAAAVAGAASGARGLASKVGSSFSGLTKQKPQKSRGKARPTSMSARSGSSGRAPGTPARSQQTARAQQAARLQQSSRAPEPPQARRAMLTLERVEPMSVMKFSFLISLVGWVVLFVAVAVIYFALSKLGVFAKIEQTVGLVTYNKTHPGTNAASWFRASRVLEYTALVCTINAILFTALATVGAALYNLVTNLTGGVEVTLKESD